MDILVEKIRQNYEKTREEVNQAAHKVGRQTNEIKIVVVTKAQPLNVVQAVIQAGVMYLGENYPEETEKKINLLGHIQGVEWHMIGHLQSRKAKIVAEHFDCMHSVDSVEIAEKLDQLCKAKKRTLSVFLEINVGGEESKSGWDAGPGGNLDLLYEDIERVLSFTNLEVNGLMTMPPLVADPEQSRPYFRQLFALREILRSRFSEKYFSALSMGTSSDYSVAVEEGSTHIRVGQAIVGPRPRRTLSPQLAL
jgi:PLP dependent protein